MTAVIICEGCGEHLMEHWQAVSHGERHHAEELAKRLSEDAEFAEKQQRWAAWQAKKAAEKARRQEERKENVHVGRVGVGRARQLAKRYGIRF